MGPNKNRWTPPWLTASVYRLRCRGRSGSETAPHALHVEFSHGDGAAPGPASSRATARSFHKMLRCVFVAFCDFGPAHPKQRINILGPHIARLIPTSIVYGSSDRHGPGALWWHPKPNPGLGFRRFELLGLLTHEMKVSLMRHWDSEHFQCSAASVDLVIMGEIGEPYRGCETVPRSRSLSRSSRCRLGIAN